VLDRSEDERRPEDETQSAAPPARPVAGFLMPVAERCARSVRHRRVRCHVVFTWWRSVVHL